MNGLSGFGDNTCFLFIIFDQYAARRPIRCRWCEASTRSVSERRSAAINSTRRGILMSGAVSRSPAFLPRILRRQAKPGRPSPTICWGQSDRRMKPWVSRSRSCGPRRKLYFADDSPEAPAQPVHQPGCLRYEYFPPFTPTSTIRIANIIAARRGLDRAADLRAAGQRRFLREYSGALRIWRRHSSGAKQQCDGPGPHQARPEQLRFPAWA